MSTFNRKRAIAAFIGALALLSGCGSGQSTSTGTNTFSYPGYPGTGGVGGGSAVGCVPLNPTAATVVGISASGYLSPLITGMEVSYGINYGQVRMTTVPTGFSYRFFTANFGDGLYLRLPDNAATMANAANIPVSGDIGTVVIGPNTFAMIQSLFGGAYYGGTNSGLCVAAVNYIWAYGTQGADIVGPKVGLTIQGPGGARQFEMYGF